MEIVPHSVVDFVVAVIVVATTAAAAIVFAYNNDDDDDVVIVVVFGVAVVVVVVVGVAVVVVVVVVVVIVVTDDYGDDVFAVVEAFIVAHVADFWFLERVINFALKLLKKYTNFKIVFGEKLTALQT